MILCKATSLERACSDVTKVHKSGQFIGLSRILDDVQEVAWRSHKCNDFTVIQKNTWAERLNWEACMSIDALCSAHFIIVDNDIGIEVPSTVFLVITAHYDGISVAHWAHDRVYARCKSFDNHLLPDLIWVRHVNALYSLYQHAIIVFTAKYKEFRVHNTATVGVASDFKGYSIRPSVLLYVVNKKGSVRAPFSSVILCCTTC